MIKISIENDEALKLSSWKEVKKDFEKDFDIILPEVDANTPCYILFRFDEKSDSNYQWLFIFYMPETCRDYIYIYSYVFYYNAFFLASTRQKMIYASTKSTLKTEFGLSLIKEEYHATQIEEMTFKGYLKNQEFLSAPKPLTTREQEMKELRRSVVKAEIGSQNSIQMMGSGIVCPVSEEALNSINEMKKGIYNYLQFEIDLEKEEINVSKKDQIDASQLKFQLPLDHARFHIFLYKHTYESDYQESYIFIYSMPGTICSVKERMMYSSCKAYFIDTIQNGKMGLDFDKKLEVDDMEELNEENLIDELHPKKLLHKTQFAKVCI